MRVLLAITYVLVSVASVCVIIYSIIGGTILYRVGSALSGLTTGSTPAVTAPVNPGPPAGLSDDELKKMLDPACVSAHPDDWRTACAS